MKELKLKIPEDRMAGDILDEFVRFKKVTYPHLTYSGQKASMTITVVRDIAGLDTEELTKLWNETFKL